MTPRNRTNSYDKKYRNNSVDSIDSCSHEIFNDKKTTFISIPIKKRRQREQPLELKKPSPVPEKFKYLLFLEHK